MIERTRRRTAAFLTVVAPLLALGVSACNSGKADEPAMGLESATVERRTISSSVAATGTVEPILVIDVKSQASGEVLEVPVELGDKVNKGDLLVRIDPRDVRNAFEQAEADLEVAKARSQIAEAQLKRTTLLRDSAVVTEDEYESALLESANAKAALVKAQTNVQLAQEKLNDVVVRAPITGTIVEKTVEEGQIITSAREVTGGTILMRMADLNEVQVRTLVDETDIGSISPGLEASIKVEAYPDRDFEGHVLKVEPQAVVEQNVTMFAVLTRIKNEQDLLKPGMNADVEIQVGRRDDVLALPNPAIKTTDEARQLVEALQLDPKLLDQKVAQPGDTTGTTASAAAPRAAGEEGLPTPQQLMSMSPADRQKAVAQLTPEQRQQLRSQFQAMQQGGRNGSRVEPGRPRDAFVFVSARQGGLTLKPVRIGLSDWEYTEVLAGLKEGDQVIEVPLALVQQRELLERIRSRTGLPGVSRG